LANLVRLGFVPLPLQVDSLFNVSSPENVMAASCALIKTQVQQKCTQIREINIRIRAAFKDTPKELIVCAHPIILSSAGR
jgi:hypothetical protein